MSNRDPGLQFGNVGRVATSQASLYSLLNAGTAISLGDSWQPGDGFRLIAAGTYFNNSGSTVAPEFRVVVGGVNDTTMVWSSSLATHASDVWPWRLELSGMCLSVSATGAFTVEGLMQIAGPGTSWHGTGSNRIHTASLTVDTTDTVSLDLQGKSGSAGTGSTNITPYVIIGQRFNASTEIV